MAKSEFSAEKLFLQVVEAGSFKKAADQLGIEPSSVSRGVAGLEQRLNVKLLQRSTRRCAPSELGQRYYLGLKQLLEEKNALEENLGNSVEAVSGKLRIGAPVDFGAEFVVPVVRELQSEFPNLSVELSLSSRLTNLMEEGVDVVVRVGEPADSSLMAARLGMIPRVLVASKDYLQRQGMPESLTDLVQYNFIFYSPKQARSVIEFIDGDRLSYNQLNSNITVNSVGAIRKLVREGAGIHVGPKWIFEEDLASAELLELFPDKALKSFPAHALYVERSYLPRKTRLFIDAMKRRLGSDSV